MFPISVEGDLPLGELSQEEVPAVLEKLQAAIARQGGKDFERDGNILRFRPRHWVLSTNIFFPFDACEVSIDPGHAPRLVYTASTRLMLTTFALMALALFFFAHTGSKPPPPVFLPDLLVAVLLLSFVIHYLIGIYRLPRFLGKALRG